MEIEFSKGKACDVKNVVDLFYHTFLNSDGEKEALLIKDLVKSLLKKDDTKFFISTNKKDIVGGIIFSKIITNCGLSGYILSPVATHVKHQRKGIGKSLIAYGLGAVKSNKDIVLTYGDPSFYSKVGFSVIDHKRIRPPFDLSHPFGWQGISFCNKELSDIDCDISCSEPLNNKVYW